jgi:hypothetical protein
MTTSEQESLKTEAADLAGTDIINAAMDYFDLFPDLREIKIVKRDDGVAMYDDKRKWKMIDSSDDSSDEGPWFVWINGMRGPEPQKWAEYYPPDVTRPAVLATHKITPLEFTETLAVLAVRYPCAVKQEARK